MGKVMSVSMERPENLMVYLPRTGAFKLLAAKDETAQQAALLQGEIFLNAQPISIWLNDAVLPPAANADDHADDTSANAQSDPAKTGAETGATTTPLNPLKPKEPPPPPPRDTSTQALAAVQLSQSATGRSDRERTGVTGPLRFLRAAEIRGFPSGNLS